VTLLGKRSDFEVSVCSHTLALNPLADRLPPAHAVVADYDSGLRLLESARAGTPPVIILTHSDSKAQIRCALEQGVRGYFLLGCSIKELVDALRSVNADGLALGPLFINRIAEWMKRQALTPREEDILRQVMLGLSNKGIAKKLTLAVGRVKTHVKAILRKLNATSRTGGCDCSAQRDSARGVCMSYAQTRNAEHGRVLGFDGVAR
jgi:DNA-binding NarL/FixJ family response regulator